MNYMASKSDDHYTYYKFYLNCINKSLICVDRSDISTSLLVSIVDHTNVERLSPERYNMGDLELSIKALCTRTCDVDAIIGCIHRLAARFSNDNARSFIMSAGLQACPILPIRDVLNMYGATANEFQYEFLYIASGNGMHDVITAWLSTAPHDTRNELIPGLMPWAVQSGDEAMIKLLIEGGATATIDLVQLALRRDHITICELLMKYSTLEFDDNCSAVLWECVHSVAAARWLCTHGASTLHALTNVSRNNHIDIVQYLIEGAKLVPSGDHWLENIISAYPDIPLLDYLLSSVTNVSQSLLDNAMHEGPLYARYLVDNGAFIDARGPFHQTPLHRACNRCFGAIDTLLILGADPRAQDEAGRTPLDLAKCNRAPYNVLYMLKYSTRGFKKYKRH